MPRGATPSRWCVCQFHHFGFLTIATSSVRPVPAQVSPEALERSAVQALAAAGLVPAAAGLVPAAAGLVPAAVDPVEPAGQVSREPRAAEQWTLRLHESRNCRLPPGRSKSRVRLR